jgi:hypothetical protein
VHHTIGNSANNNDAEWKHFYVLLKFKVSVKGDKNIANGMCATKQFAIFYSRSAQAMYGVNLIRREIARKIGRKMFVKQNPHARQLFQTPRQVLQ